MSKSFARKQRSGSVLIVTVNSDLRGEKKLSNFTSSVGDENVPLGTTEEDLGESGSCSPTEASSEEQGG